MNKKCPWCGSEKAQIHLWLKDEFLTKEDFQIYECLQCGLLYTDPRPDQEKIGQYYKSEEYYSHQENTKGFIPKIYETVKSINLKKKYKIAANGRRFHPNDGEKRLELYWRGAIRTSKIHRVKKDKSQNDKPRTFGRT